MDPVIAEQPYDHPVADAAIVDAEFAPDPAGAPLQAVPAPRPRATPTWRGCTPCRSSSPSRSAAPA